MKISFDPIDYILINESTIQSRVTELAHQISNDYKETGNLMLIGILKGAFILMADLTRKLNIAHVVDFMAVSSYGDSSISSGAVRIMLDLRKPILGQHILIVEDIVDTGNTLNYLYNTLSGRKPASIKTCSLLRKKRNNHQINIDYLGFDIPDVWVVGYGLDYADQFRTLPYVAVLKKSHYTK